MMKFILSLLLLLLAASPLSAAYTLKDGQLVNLEELDLLSPQEHYSLLLDASDKGHWQELQKQASIILQHFQDSPFHQEALFYLGKAYFHQKEYELSNKQLSLYLKKQASLQHFHDAIDLKFQIAEQFKDGAKKHLMGWDALPKWIPASSEALKIYNEVINALPNDDLAAKSLYGKASIELLDEEFTASIETYKSLIRKFPKHALTPEAHVQIGKVYLVECQKEYPDSDFLDLAHINFRQFQQSFPNDERVVTIEKMLTEMKEVYAKSFYEIAQFFERTKKTNASLIYYSKIIKYYPGTKCAELSKKRLTILRPVTDTSQNQHIVQENTTVVPPS